MLTGGPSTSLWQAWRYGWGPLVLAAYITAVTLAGPPLICWLWWRAWRRNKHVRATTPKERTRS
ncbi:hypothetical protein [Streptomyces sp. NBC_01304]|uniref:hypothetical protein n=1 Tax=Streptomyces sp. NBC_01304 TaxID=2903818 RepID=UPI002E121FB2|nr:hypothetical protein OG430_44880 [Streptomyces sp. NBC_01304]